MPDGFLSLTLSPHPPSLPGFVLLAAYPHHRRHLSKRAVFGSSFDAHTVIAPPRRTPGKNALRRPRIMASHQGIHPNAPPHDKQDEAKDRTRGWRAVPLVASLIVPRIRRRPVAYCPQGLSIPGRRQFPWHISRAVFLSSSHPSRLIASSIQRLTIPFGQAGKQARQDGGRSSAVLGPVIVSPPRLVIAPLRLVPRVVGRGAVSSSSPLIAFHEEGGGFSSRLLVSFLFVPIRR